MTTKLYTLKGFLCFFLFGFSLTSNAQEMIKRHFSDKREIVDKRDMFAKHYDDNGSVIAAISNQPIHYDNNGRFEEINTTVVSSSNQNFPFANTSNLMQSYFGQNSSIGVKTKISGEEVLEFVNLKMYWQTNASPSEFSKNKVFATSSGNKVIYSNLFGNDVSAEFVVENAKRKLNYIIPSVSSLQNIPINASHLIFSEDIILPSNWSVIVENGDLNIYDTNKTRVLKYENPYSFDSNGRKMRDNNTSAEYLINGNTITVLTKVSVAWLINGDRLFPVTIDPTVVALPDASTGNCGSLYSSDYYIIDDAIYFGRDLDNNGVQDFMRGWAKFNTTSIPDNATINPNITVTFEIGDVNGFSHASGHQLALTQILPNPLSMQAQVLFNAINQSGYQPLISNGLETLGQKTYTITSQQATADLKSLLTSNYFNFGFMPIGNYFAEQYAGAYGYSQKAPFIQINYTEQSTPDPDSTVSVDLIDQNLVQIFPNPTTGLLSIESTNDQSITQVFLKDMSGKLIKEIGADNMNQIDITEQSAGIYFLELHSNFGIKTVKLVKK